MGASAFDPDLLVFVIYRSRNGDDLRFGVIQDSFSFQVLIRPVQLYMTPGLTLSAVACVQLFCVHDDRSAAPVGCRR